MTAKGSSCEDEKESGDINEEEGTLMVLEFYMPETLIL